MRVETVQSGYSVPKSTPIGYYEASLSPDGWRDSRYVNDTAGADHLRSDEIREFVDFVRSFFHDFDSQNELLRYCKKHGRTTDSITYSMRFDCALMAYVVTITGYSAVFRPYRKENA